MLRSKGFLWAYGIALAAVFIVSLVVIVQKFASVAASSPIAVGVPVTTATPTPLPIATEMPDIEPGQDTTSVLIVPKYTNRNWRPEGASPSVTPSPFPNGQVTTPDSPKPGEGVATGAPGTITSEDLDLVTATGKVVSKLGEDGTPATEKELTAALDAAGIPYVITSRDGKATGDGENQTGKILLVFAKDNLVSYYPATPKGDFSAPVLSTPTSVTPGN